MLACFRVPCLHAPCMHGSQCQLTVLVKTFGICTSELVKTNLSVNFFTTCVHAKNAPPTLLQWLAARPAVFMHASIDLCMHDLRLRAYACIPMRACHQLYFSSSATPLIETASMHASTRRPRGEQSFVISTIAMQANVTILVVFLNHGRIFILESLSFLVLL